MHFPQWVDLKGQDSVPDTVHQVVCIVDPKNDKSWIRLRSKIGDSITVRLRSSMSKNSHWTSFSGLIGTHTS